MENRERCERKRKGDRKIAGGKLKSKINKKWGEIKEC